MKLNNAINALARKGHQMLEVSTTETVYNRRFEGKINNYRIVIWSQGEDVSTMRVIPANDHDDTQSDYFAGSFADTIPQLLRFAGIF